MDRSNFTATKRTRTIVVPPFMGLMVQAASARKTVMYTFDGVTRPHRDMGLRIPAAPGMVYIVDEADEPTEIRVKMASVSGPARVTTIMRPRQ